MKGSHFMMRLRRFRPALLACAFWLLAQPAQAVISCTVSSPGFTSFYDTTAGTANDSVSSATITCTRASGDASTQTYSLATNQGLRSRSNSYRASQNGQTLNYDVYKNAGRTTTWDQSNPFTGTINFGAGTSVTLSLPYYTRIPALQNVPAGVYTDTVTMTLTYGAATAVASYPVQNYVNTTCLISTPPGSVTFNYASFQTAAATASTTFTARCTSGLPYTLSLDAGGGTQLGINYSLLLPVTTGTGNGVNQTYSINGTAVANQAGSCASPTCSATDSRTLTLSF
ncbi:spore coat U domain-containing protein [Polaromonas sp.]|uniref:Csu type fimbrial protein n=1 Tax=Polaromonas sp. TaxID=1869339 RepID=UPI0018166A90|nr:spore coat U domain-containing protein [Polaromonas sp.]NMM05587.1 spore coat protein U domain-containing protein [Polaromonas sp.]